MAIYAYRNISEHELNAVRTTSEGKKYTLNHPDELVVDMRYKGEGKSNANSQGWERSSSYYFKKLHNHHPEYFSRKNTIRIENGESPKVDSKFVKAFPQYKGYENETLVHHHVGKDGQAVAVPQSLHKGSGEIHYFENDLGITEEARSFSEQCKILSEQDPSLVGKSSDYFKSHNIQAEAKEVTETDREKTERVLVRRKEVTPEVQQGRDRDTDSVLDNYRDNLRDYGVPDEAAIDKFVAGEREKINAEYASLERGDEFPKMYETPTDWERISSSMKQNGADSMAGDEVLKNQIASIPVNHQSKGNAFSNATSKKADSTGERQSHGNAFSNATNPSYSNLSTSNIELEKTSMQSKSERNAFSEASSISRNNGTTRGTSKGGSSIATESRSQ